MYTVRKYISYTLIFCISLTFFVPSFAATNKETLLQTIATLDSSISKTTSDQDALLAKKAYELSSAYDNRVKALSLNPDDISILLQSNKINIPDFRREVSEEYLSLKQNLFKDIRQASVDLSLIKDEVSLRYTEVSDGQKAVYDQKIQGIKNRQSSFLTGSTIAIDSFVNTFSGRIDQAVSEVGKKASENKDYLSLIGDLRWKYSQIEAELKKLVSQNSQIEKEIFPRLQNNIVLMNKEKSRYTDALSRNLKEWLNRALQQEKLKKQEGDISLYYESIMQKWQRFIENEFADDEDLLMANLKAKNIVNSEKELRNKIYDENGIMRFAELTSTGPLLKEVDTLLRDLVVSNGVLTEVIKKYGTIEASDARNIELLNALHIAYKSKLSEYQDEFQRYIEEKYTGVSAAEENYKKTLKLFSLQEEILKKDLSSSLSLSYQEKRLSEFVETVDAIAKSNGEVGAIKGANTLKYKYLRSLNEKKIEVLDGTRYSYLRKHIESAMSEKLYSLENKLGKQKAEEKVGHILGLLESKLQSEKNPKTIYIYRVINSSLLSYLENAQK